MLIPGVCDAGQTLVAECNIRSFWSWPHGRTVVDSRLGRSYDIYESIGISHEDWIGGFDSC